MFKSLIFIKLLLPSSLLGIAILAVDITNPMTMIIRMLCLLFYVAIVF